jgi:hypothetical protein
MGATVSRDDFAKTLLLEAERDNVRLYLSTPESRQLVTGLWRDGKRVIFATSSGFGLTLHRHAGISFPGLPRSGGTSILWGAANERVGTLGSDHRAFHFGPIGIYIGSDF